MNAPDPRVYYREIKELVAMGQPVFPCRAENAIVQTKKGMREVKAKAPYTQKGLKDATTDLSQIKRWWRNHGESAIGIPTGIIYDVLDVDSKGEGDGRVHLPRLHRLGLLNGCKKVVRTPSGGWHLYFLTAPGLTNKAHATLGLDVRSAGGYVLAPPSWIDDEEKSVGSYEMVGETTGSTDEPLLWDLIVKTLAPVSETTKKPIELLGYERQASVASLKGWLSERQSGERNNALHWAVCRCIDNRIDPNELVDVALMLGLSNDEVSLTIDSALKRAGLVASDLDTEAEALFGKA